MDILAWIAIFLALALAGLSAYWGYRMHVSMTILLDEQYELQMMLEKLGKPPKGP